MTAEERFEKIERDLAVVAHVHSLQQETLSQLMKSVSAFIGSSSARTARLEHAVDGLAGQLSLTGELVTRFIQSADTRMKRLEDNLETLIRALTAQHGNGKN